jgi:hypothetical protein
VFEISLTRSARRRTTQGEGVAKGSGLEKYRNSFKIVSLGFYGFEKAEMPQT